MTRGIVLRGGPDPAISGRAKAAGTKVVTSDDYDVPVGASLPFDKTLIVEAGTRIPYDLLPAAWHFLDRWDAAVPLWRYGVTAADVGLPEEREATKAIIHDLRVLLHSVELLFVRRNEPGRALVDAWRDEAANGPDRRLAFLRALYRVKPRLCVLPTSWLAGVCEQSQQALYRGRRGAQSINAGRPLVTVELEPGRFVKMHVGDEERALEAFERQRGARGRR